MNNELSSVFDSTNAMPIEKVAPTQADVLKAKSKVLLESLYDEMILWNMKRETTPLLFYLGLPPKDYLHFMQDPEGWAYSYVDRQLMKKAGASFT